MKNAWNHEIKCKGKGKRDLPAFKDKNLAKILEENDKKSMVEPLAKLEREKSWKNFLKKSFWKRQSDLLKTMFHKFRLIEKQPRSIETDRDSIKTIWKEFEQLKNSFDRSKQTETLSNIIKKFRSIEKQNGSIEMGRGLLNLRKNTVFEKHIESTQSIEI